MTVNEYQKLALRTLGHETNNLLEALMGLCGEAGECINILKKNIFQGHDEPDRKHLAEELGDVAWYLAEAAHAIGYDLDDIFRMNIEKLEKRYPNGFETEKSINRE